ncbi:MAG: hypothetical protein V1708_05520 [Candidatus Micrarchaeota archaeon]
MAATSFEMKSERKNQLFGRRECTAMMSVEAATPNRKEVLKLIADKTASAEDCIVLEKIEHRYGTRNATLYFRVYDSAALAKKEPAYKSERSSGKKKEDGGEAKKKEKKAKKK